MEAVPPLAAGAQAVTSDSSRTATTGLRLRKKWHLDMDGSSGGWVLQQYSPPAPEWLPRRCADCASTYQQRSDRGEINRVGDDPC
ncbi:MAG TPA: hypothetical protein VHD89_10895, partial [Rhodanobacteraceae bacterium]|nr:hypothetical protein [Rhodanobacteraceae bacterium]